MEIPAAPVGQRHHRLWSQVNCQPINSLGTVILHNLKKLFMPNKLTATSEISINASAGKVWQAFVDPEMIKQYLFGTDVHTDWKVGSPITYTGEWQGKSYTDKGKIIDIQPGKLLHTTYWSGNSGKPDVPENYANVVYEIHPDGDSTKVTITQDNIENEEGVKHMKENWGKVLDGMKKAVEK